MLEEAVLKKKDELFKKKLNLNENLGLIKIAVNSSKKDCSEIVLIMKDMLDADEVEQAEENLNHDELKLKRIKL